MSSSFSLDSVYFKHAWLCYKWSYLQLYTKAGVFKKKSDPEKGDKAPADGEWHNGIGTQIDPHILNEALALYYFEATSSPGVKKQFQEHKYLLNGSIDG